MRESGEIASSKRPDRGCRFDISPRRRASRSNRRWCRRAPRYANGAAIILAPSLRRRDADCDQRRIGGGQVGAARDLAFADKGCLIARRPAISTDQHLVAAAGRCAIAARQAGLANDPHSRTGRTLLTLRARWTGRADGTGRTRRTGVTLGARRPLRPGIALWSLTAASKPNQQQPDQQQISATHFFPPAAWTGAPAPHIQ